MARSRLCRYSIWVFSVLMFATGAAFAQFTASIQGEIQDQSGAGVAKASIHLVNTGTGATSVVTSDDGGNYRFVSIAPGSYKITVEAAGFSKAEADVTLLTEQNLNLPISLRVGGVTESVIVTTEAPIVDTADSRTQLTLDNQAVAQLPIIGRNLVTLVTLAPGVSGLGTSTSGSPASGVDNLLHGRAGGRQRQRPRPKQQSIRGRWPRRDQRNSPGRVESDSAAGRHPGNQRSGEHVFERVQPRRRTADHVHNQIRHRQVPRLGIGLVQLPGDVREPAFRKCVEQPYKPFHSNNMDFAIGGPIIPHHNSFFLLRSRTAALIGKRRWIGNVRGSGIHSFAQTNYPGHGRNACAHYLFAFGCWRNHRAANGADVFGSGAAVRHYGGTKWRALHLAHDRLRVVRRHADPKRHAVLCPHRRRVQERPRLRQPFPDSSDDRRGLAMPQFSALNHTWQVPGRCPGRTPSRRTP